MAYSKHPTGSAWRKWDLHLHSPMSGMANGFPQLADGPDWEKYLAELEKLTDVPVIGVTDYFLIEGYKKLREFKAAGRLPNIELLLPNIEFRLDQIVAGKRINFHVIFSDQVSVADIEDHFLSNLEITIEGHAWLPADVRKLRRSSLVELGAKYKAEQGMAGSDFQIGCTTAVVRLSQIMELLTSNSKFRDRYVTCLAEENLSLMDWAGQDHGVRKVLLQSTQVMFSANLKSIQWCLGKKHGTVRDYLVEFKSLKPCIIGSDAHKLDQIGVWPNNRPTWVKADTTFEGLRQILCEPEDRVCIGTTPPDEKDATKVIKSITIAKAGAWMADQTIELSRDLVAIIGGKGSGKTALADMLGYGGGDFDNDSEKSFLAQAREYFEGTEVGLTWERGGADPMRVVHDGSAREPKVRYLSQSFVENLCSHDQHERLVNQIEDILFQYVPTTQKMGAADFASLKDLKTRAVQREIAKTQSNIRLLNAEIATIEEEIEKKPAVAENVAKLQKEKQALEAQKPPAATPAAQKEQEDLQKLREKRAQLEKVVEAKRITIGELDEIRARARLLKTDVEEFNTAVQGKLDAWGLTDKAASLAVIIPVDLAIVLNDRIGVLEKEVKAVEGNPGAAEANPETIFAVDKQIRAIEAKSQVEAQQKAKLAAFGKRIAELTTIIEATLKQIAALETTRPTELADKRRRRGAEFRTFFERLAEKKRLFEELYQPLNEPTEVGAERGKVEFYARFNFDVKRFIADGMGLFDGRKMVVRSDSKLAEHSARMWQQLQQAIPAVTVDPLREFDRILRGGEPPARSIAEQLVGEYRMRDYYNWLFNTECYDVEYGIKYEKVDLDKLSPGRKGVVLLMIYLDVDRDFRPLIIDQPEENLDNRSVYSTLVEYFRRAKKKRQIILITHNANLVVNADAEQVIVANFDLDKAKQATVIEYVSGSLEFSRKFDAAAGNILLAQGIREHVCEILEGGDEAFQRRERKYAFPGI
jgi:ABC-type lipoprotein export system ATPase subunit